MSDFLNLVSEFIDESNVQISEIKKYLPAFSDSLRKKKSPLFQQNSRLIRAIHSISGGSSFSGLHEIERTSSKLEKVISLIVNKKVEPTENLAEIIERAVFILENALKNNGKIKKKEGMKIEKEMDEILSFSSGNDNCFTEKEINIDIPDGTATFRILDIFDVSEKLKNQYLYVLKFDAASDISEEEVSLIQVVSILSQKGKILDSVIEIDQVEEQSIPISILYMSELSYDQVKKHLKFLPEKAIIKIQSESIESAFKIKAFCDDPSENIKEISKSSAVFGNPIENIKVNALEREEDIEENDEVQTNKYVSFKIGEEHYAVPIEVVFDMKEMLPCSRIPNQPAHFLGVTNLRGNVVPVIDLRVVFGIKNVIFNEFTVFLMLKVNNKIRGCVVDAIDDVVFLEPENTQITPLLSRKIKTDFVRFIAKDPKTNRFLIVLDVEKMIENE